MYRLILPTAKYAKSYHAYIAELGDEERYPFPLDFDASDFDAMLARIAGFADGTGVPEGWVPSSTFWLMEGDEIIGCSNLRHFLNDTIAHCGGHIGLGIRPSYRGKSLGIELLQRTLQQAQQRGIDPVHIHCHSDNAASNAMIRACGGHFDSAVQVGDAHIHRYLIKAIRQSDPD